METEDVGGCWIPPQIYHKDELTHGQKIFLGRIHSLSKQEGFCFATNEYLSNDTGVSMSTIKRWIPDLIDKGVLTRKDQETNRKLRVVLNQNNPSYDNTPQNDTGGGAKMIRVGGQNDTGHIDKNKHKDNNKDYKDEIQEVFDFWLKSKAGTEHRSLSEAIKKPVRARLREGYDVDYIKKAIANLSKAYNNDDYYWSHRWGLDEFCKRGQGTKLEKFHGGIDWAKNEKDNNGDDLLQKWEEA